MSDRHRGWVATLRQCSVAQLILMAGVWLVAAGLLCVWYGLEGGTHIAEPEVRATVVAAGWWACLAGTPITLLALAYARRRHGRFWPPPCAAPGERVAVRAWLWSLIAAIGLMLYPAFVALSRNPYRHVVWLVWGLQDYRWLIAMYFIAIGAIVALPPLASRWLEPGGLVTEAPPVGRLRRARPVLAFVYGVVVSALLFAPPWNIARTSGQVGNHDVHLSQLQAIHTGTLPYIGPASIQYGPGSQLLQYAYMTRTGRFSLLGYRETYPLFQLVAFACFTAAAVGSMGFVYGTLIALLALYLSPFNMLHWGGDVLSGFLGWANPLRYVGTFVVVSLLPPVLRGAGRAVTVPALLLGIVWGVFTWLSQENLMSTVLAGGLFVVVAWALRACSFAQARRTVVGLGLGWLAVVVPILAFYATRGELGRFVEGYFLIPRFVAAGMSNTPWNWQVETAWNAAFILTPVMFFGVACLTTFDWPRRRFAAPPSPDRQQLLAFVSVALVCFIGALLRKDAAHFQNALIGLPAVLVGMAAVVINERRRSWRQLLVLPLLVAFVGVFPGGNPVGQFLKEYRPGPWRRFWSPPSNEEKSAWRGENGVAFERAGAFTSADYRIFEDAAPAREFLEAMNQLKATIADRPVYVHSFPRVPAEAVYFYADLTPGPLLFNVSTMIFNTEIQARFLAHMQAHCREFGAMVGVDPQAGEVEIFKKCHPDAMEMSTHIAGDPFYVWLTP